MNDKSSFCPNCGKPINESLSNSSLGKPESFVKIPKVYHRNGRLYKDQFAPNTSGTTIDETHGKKGLLNMEPFLTIGSFVLAVLIMFVITDLIVFLIDYTIYHIFVIPLYKTGNLDPNLTLTTIYNKTNKSLQRYHYFLWGIILVFSIIQICLFQFFYSVRKVPKEKLKFYLYKISYLILPIINILAFALILVFLSKYINRVDYYLIKLMLLCGLITGIGFHFYYRVFGFVKSPYLRSQHSNDEDFDHIGKIIDKY